LVFLLIGLGLYFLYRAWHSTKASFWQFILVLFGLSKEEVAGNLALGRAMLKPFFLAGVILAIDFFSSFGPPRRSRSPGCADHSQIESSN
jgi:hypothetical protein